MLITVVKNPKESFERLVNRFQKKVTQSRKLLRIKSKRFHKSKPTKRYERASAVMRSHHRARRRRLQFY